MAEKTAANALPTYDPSYQPPARKSNKWKWLASVAGAALLVTHVNPYIKSSSLFDSELDFEALGEIGAICPKQPEPLPPKNELVFEPGYRNYSAHLLSEAVQIPTQSFDDNGLPTEDPRWAPFFDFQKWLIKTFPLINEKAKIEYVNTLGILMTLEGSDPSLKPLVFMSHYDVVPAPENTADRWTHGLFSGFVDDEWVWGRGSADDKTLLVGQWEALTLLLKSGFTPRRTIIFSHGFDEEEVFARQGACTLAPFLEDRYGKDGVLLIIDEGAGQADAWGAPFAIPSNAEKGYMDVRLIVGTPGGHSSVPPDHTGIGIMSEIITSIEAHPYEPTLSTHSPHLGYLTCGAKYSPNFPSKFKKLLKDPKKWPKLAKIWAEESLARKAMLGTTQAIDVLVGGVKVNALPERVELKMNHRIDFASSVKETQEHLSKAIEIVTKKYNMTFSSFGSLDGEDLGPRYVIAELFGVPLEPAVVTPEKGPLWEMFAGTIKAAIPGPNGEERIVAPSSSTGNTDTKCYHGLSPNIFRFAGGKANAGSNAHTVDEKTSIDSHLDVVKWLWAIMQNTDAYDGPE